MNWEEYCLARLLMAEERIGRHIREQDLADLEKDREGGAALRARGMEH